MRGWKTRWVGWVGILVRSEISCCSFGRVDVDSVSMLEVLKQFVLF